MYLLNLDNLPGQESMLVFHALARMGVEALVMVSPTVPLVSVGYFQDAAKEVDLDFCREAAIPVMRREVGGGATYLDENQIFYQVIWSRDNSRFPRAMSEIYRYLSEPVCQTYQRFGIQASFRAENDIITGAGKKIAGEGGANIGDSMVFVGGILLDFDYRTMSRVLRVPDEKFRDKINKTMEANLTTMKRELGSIPPRADIRRVLREEFEKILGRLEPVTLDDEIRRKMLELEQWFTSAEFLHKKTPKIPKGVKIRAGVEILYGLYKARGGLIRTAEEVHGSTLSEIAISGDFTFLPKEGLADLETDLSATSLDERALVSKIDEFYEKKKIETPGVTSADFTKAIVEAKPESQE